MESSTPFEFGSHVRYIGAQRWNLPAGSSDREVVLAPGMIGVVILTSGTTPAWHCQVQFRNGYHVEVTADNRALFESAHARFSCAPPVLAATR